MDTPTANGDWPETIDSADRLDGLLSRPAEPVVDVFRRLEGGLTIFGGSGKIGPSLVRMACRARQAAGTTQDITVVALFPDPAVRAALESAGAKTIECDLLDPAAIAKLPVAPNVIYMVGMKFGTSDRPALTWAVNALPPAYVAERCRASRIVTFSTGCVYNLTPASSEGSVETDPLEPIGEYSNACVARERIFDYFAEKNRTPMVHVRLNYAVETRYGVLVDLAQKIAAGRPVDLTMGYFNVIWQGDVNAAVLRLLAHAACPPMAINLTGAKKLSVRDVALRLGELMGKPVQFTGTEAETALLSDASKAHALLGPPATPVERVIAWVADWVGRDQPTLGKPTHFESRDGRY